MTRFTAAASRMLRLLDVTLLQPAAPSCRSPRLALAAKSGTRHCCRGASARCAVTGASSPPRNEIVGSLHSARGSALGARVSFDTSDSRMRTDLRSSFCRRTLFLSGIVRSLSGIFKKKLRMEVSSKFRSICKMAPIHS